MKNKNVWRFISENIFSILSIVIGVAVIIFQGIGLINGDPISIVILALLATLATSQVVETNRKFDRLEELLEKEIHSAILSLNGVEIKKFITPEDGFEYLTTLINSAKNSIDHISMADFTPRWSRQYKSFRQARDAVLKANKIHYRYVVNISGVEQKKIEDLRRWAGDASLKRFYISYYNLPFYKDRKSFPYQTIMIVDSKEVFVYYPHNIGEPEVTYSIKHPVLVEMFSDYFKRVWTTANSLNATSINALLGTENNNQDKEP